ncbi:unnamed protein product [Lactuca virosa]|uniref:Nucleoplasmin-like domain-containing protein n=1 Tax=Lactuca virosa TaxID=75947 RepID=A0AAU9NPC5_9ASTR|nr:unnamed protein product [Lactuca virosa]
MEPWTVEVKSGQSYPVKLGKGKVLFLSQANLGVSKKKTNTNDYVCLQITYDNKKFVIGTLHTKRLSIQVYGLFFDKDIYISHDWKDGSVYFYGYTCEQPPDELSGKKREKESASKIHGTDKKAKITNTTPSTIGQVRVMRVKDFVGEGD